MRRGQTLIEILVAMGLAAIFFGGTVLVFSQILSSDKKNREVQTAIDLANELSDKVRIFAEADWHNLDRYTTSSIITVDAVTVATSSGVDRVTFQHMALGENRILVVAVASRDPTDIHRTVSGITFGLGTLTKIRSDDAEAGGSEHTELWYLLAPSIGGWNSVTVRFGGVVDNVTVAAISLNGIEQQSNPIDASAGTNSGGTPGNPQLNITTASDTSMVLDVLAYGNAVNFNPGSGQVEIWDTPHNGYPFGSTGSYQGPVSPPQSVSLNHSKSGGGAAKWVMSAASFRRAASIASHNYYLEATSTGLSLVNGEQNLVIDNVNYTLYYYVENVSRDASHNIETIYNASNNDPSTKKVVIRINWGIGGSGLTFHQILTRNKSQIFRQTDWSGGAGQENFSGESSNNRFSTSTGVDFSNSGSIKVQGY